MSSKTLREILPGIASKLVNYFEGLNPITETVCKALKDTDWNENEKNNLFIVFKMYFFFVIPFSLLFNDNIFFVYFIFV